MNYQLTASSGSYTKIGSTTTLSKLGLNSIKIAGYYSPIHSVEAERIPLINLNARLSK